MASTLNLEMEKLNATMRKFGAPGSCIQDYSYWTVLLRPAQVTLGSLVLVAREPVTAFSALSPDSFDELKQVTTNIENSLRKAFSCEKLNYLMLMMVDPDVHFHVIPRYSDIRKFENMDFHDRDWPGPPDLTRSIDTGDSMNQQILGLLRENWIL